MPTFNEPVIADTQSENAVEGHSKTARGVVGSSETHYGVRGHSRVYAGVRGSSKESRGVEGMAEGSGEGVAGYSASGHGVWGATGGNAAGVIGTSTNGTGVLAYSTNWEAVHAETHAAGVAAIAAYNLNPAARGAAIFARNDSRLGHAGYFAGNVEINGTLTVRGLGIDPVQLASVGSLAQRVAALENMVGDLQRSVGYLLTVAHFH